MHLVALVDEGGDLVAEVLISVEVFEKVAEVLEGLVGEGGEDLGGVEAELVTECVVGRGESAAVCGLVDGRAFDAVPCGGLEFLGGGHISLR